LNAGPARNPNAKIHDETQPKKERRQYRMYEQPKLIPVGDAEDVVLGGRPSGNDIDANWCDQDFEFAEEVDIDTLSA
jgi:hypothetical protein